MRPSDQETTKILSDAHVEFLRGVGRRPAKRKAPRAN
jgi:hypothetical protein